MPGLSYFFSVMTALVLSSFGMRVLRRHYKFTTERNRQSWGSSPLWSDPIGPGSGFSVIPGI